MFSGLKKNAERNLVKYLLFHLLKLSEVKLNSVTPRDSSHALLCGDMLF